MRRPLQTLLTSCRVPEANARLVSGRHQRAIIRGKIEETQGPRGNGKVSHLLAAGYIPDRDSCFRLAIPIPVSGQALAVRADCQPIPSLVRSALELAQ